MTFAYHVPPFPPHVARLLGLSTRAHACRSLRARCPVAYAPTMAKCRRVWLDAP